jgi:hypothetical protein
MSFEDCATKFRCTISKQMEDEEKEKLGWSDLESMEVFH